ncbi:hypothetical protein BGZ65_002924, partial [Modicella reniformis]
LVKFALDNGQPIDSAINGVQSIHAACCSNANVPVVLFLIGRGADVNARRCPRKYSGERIVGAHTVGTTGSTPLHFAAANGCKTIVETLLRHGATADLADKYGSTPYSVATARGHVEIASRLHQHACMQRGLQVITPDSELRDRRERDSFTSPRNSSDFSRRVSAIMTPTRSSTQQENPTATVTATTAVAASASALTVNQRRVSLPSIVEAPSSPPATRQSCDLSRVPLSKDPLNPPGNSVEKPTTQSQNSDQHQQRKSSQSILPSLGNTFRRRSEDVTATGYFSLRSSRTIHRRTSSFDQLAAVCPLDNKVRRDSVASTSETIVSSPSSCSTLASPIMLSGHGSRTHLEMMPIEEIASNKTQGETCAMMRSSSQPPQSPIRDECTRRASSASEPIARQSFDLRLFARGHGLSEARENVSEEKEVKKGKKDRHFKSYRRRSIQEPLAGTDHDQRSFLRSIKMTSSLSAASFQPMEQDKAKANKHRLSLSGMLAS